MLLLTNIIICVLLFEFVHPLNLLSIQTFNLEDENKFDLNQILKYLIANRRNGRKFDPSYLQETKLLYDSLKRNASASDLKQWLRQKTESKSEQQTTVLPDKHRVSEIIEKELKHAISKKVSALFDRPYLQKKGKHDFLVINPDAYDPFASIIPNNIYYNHEKKCVNWLDECNAQGIRSVLLQKIRSPFK